MLTVHVPPWSSVSENCNADSRSTLINEVDSRSTPPIQEAQWSQPLIHNAASPNTLRKLRFVVVSTILSISGSATEYWRRMWKSTSDSYDFHKVRSNYCLFFVVCDAIKGKFSSHFQTHYHILPSLSKLLVFSKPKVLFSAHPQAHLFSFFFTFFSFQT